VDRSRFTQHGVVDGHAQVKPREKVEEVDAVVALHEGVEGVAVLRVDLDRAAAHKAGVNEPHAPRANMS